MAAERTVRLKAPHACAPFERDGRRYVPSDDGVVEAPVSLVDDLLAHGFMPLTDGATPPLPRERPWTKSGKKHGRR